MKIRRAVEDFIADKDSSIPGQALNSKTHGAYSYLSRSAENRPLSADIAQVEAAVVADAEENGAISQVQRQAVRLQTAAELLWRHMQGNPEQFKSYLKSWGWLSNSAIRAWRELESLRRSAAVDDVATNRVLEAYDDNELTSMTSTKMRDST